MNTQDIITPVAQFIEWTNTVLLPISNSFKLAVIGLRLVGLLFWLRLQKKYNVRAEQDGTIKSDQTNFGAFREGGFCRARARRTNLSQVSAAVLPSPD